MCPSRIPDGKQRGWIVPIGGAEDRESRRQILKRFVRLCGGRDARIVIIPTASRKLDTGARYVDLFERLEAGPSTIVDFATREDGAREDYLRAIEDADGVFFTGGNQLRISTILGGTAAARLIRNRNAHGMHVAGTSAGAMNAVVFTDGFLRGQQKGAIDALRTFWSRVSQGALVPMAMAKAMAPMRKGSRLTGRSGLGSR